MSEPTPEQLSELEVDSGMSGEAVEQAECLWAQLPTGRPWTSLKTYEKALVCHQFARLRVLERPSDEAVELRAERDALLQKPIDLAKMDSIDEDATDKMIAYYWWQQAQEARAAIAAMQEQSK